MSAITNPLPGPVQAPERVRPVAVQPQPKKPLPWKLWLILAALVCGGLMAYRTFEHRRQARNVTPGTSIRTAKIITGGMERGTRVSGVTSAANFASIAAPMMRGPDGGRSLILIRLASSGAVVKKGEMVAEIDSQSIKDHLEDVKDMVVQAEGDIKKRKAEQAIEWENLQQTLRTAKAELDKAKLDAGASDIRTPIDVELLKLSVEEAEAQYKQLQNDLINKKKAHDAEIRILEITRYRQVAHRTRHEVDVAKMILKAPMDGLVVMQQIWRTGEMGQVQEGDQVSPGQPFMKIVNTSSMRVDANVNQAESEKIRVGQTASIDFDAFPGLHMKGKVTNVGAMGIGGWRLNYFIRNVPVRLSIEGADNRVIPDLSASAGIVFGRKPSAVLAPLEALNWEKGKPVVFVKDGDRFAPKEVQVGMRNNLQFEVLAGLEAGQEVALSRPPAS